MARPEHWGGLLLQESLFMPTPKMRKVTIVLTETKTGLVAKIGSDQYEITEKSFTNIFSKIVEVIEEFAGQEL